MLPTKYPIFFL